VARTVDTEADGWGPTVDGRARRRRRPLRVIAVLLVVILVAVLALALFASSRIPRQPVDGLAGSGSPMHVLVTGSDSREGLSREQQNELTIGRDEGTERTDTIFLMTIDGGQVGLLAFPRDLWVRRCDGTTGRINVAVQIGGPSCLVQTVRDLSGIDVQHHVQVTFGGFRDVVDAVDGVEVCLDEPIADRDAGIDLPSGCQRLDGVDALGYVRVRKIDNDLQRIQRQQQFVRALAGEIAQPATLLNPARMLRLSNDVGGALTVDDGMGIVPLLRLTRGARGLAGGATVTETVPSTVGAAGDAQVLFVDEAAAAPVFAAFADGSVFDGAEAATAVEPGDVPVRVLNGAGAPGLAGQVAAVLDGRGYPIVEVGNTDQRARTVVQHPRSQAEGARAVARDLPGDIGVEAADVPQVTVLLGSDAAGR
jgi:LCP family protein required for cell wall assembly